MMQHSLTRSQRAQEWFWRKVPKRSAIVILILIAIGLSGILVLNYDQQWTGFGPRISAEGKLEPARTLWDWLQLLIIPIALSFAAFLLNRSERRTEQKVARDRDETAQRIAADDRHERELQDYFDRMTDLLLREQLLSAGGDSQVRTVARARTLTVLRSLDSDRQLAVLRFLRELSKGRASADQSASEMLSPFNPDAFLFSMKGAYLPTLASGADFSGGYLAGIWILNPDLHVINLSDADLSDALLSGANMTGANLVGANLSGANFFKANLSGASLAAANLSGTLLSDANLSGANFFKANLDNTFLAGANLIEADSLTPGQLCASAVLVSVIMPNGSKWAGRPEGPYTVQDLAPYFPNSNAFLRTQT